MPSLGFFTYIGRYTGLTHTMNTHLEGVVVCTVGDLSKDAGHNQWAEENIKRWLGFRGGRFVDEMDDSVTHLLCSRGAWKTKKDKGEFVSSFLFLSSSFPWDVTPRPYSRSNHGIRAV